MTNERTLIMSNPKPTMSESLQAIFTEALKNAEAETAATCVAVLRLAAKAPDGEDRLKWAEMFIGKAYRLTEAQIREQVYFVTQILVDAAKEGRL